METNINILKNFDINSIPDLDIAVLGALELFQIKKIPKLDISSYNRPLIVGSGNAEATGRIIFKDRDAIFASESNFEDKLKNIKGIDGVVLVSASGEKHAPTVARISKQHGKPVTLITNAQGSSASRELDHNTDTEYLFPKNREPYTYNTSTYMGMILGYTGENSAEIYEFIKNNIDTIDFSKVKKYDKFYFIVPPRFSEIIRMLQVKFIELFGRNIAHTIETSEYVPHATTIAPAKELFISFGYNNQIWGNVEDRVFIPLPENANYGAMMAIGYYIVAQIQKRHHPYFKENIEEYVKQTSKIFGHELSAIVD